MKYNSPTAPEMIPNSVWGIILESGSFRRLYISSTSAENASFLGVQGHTPPVNVLDFNSLKSPFSGFRVTQIGYWPVPFTLDKALQLGKFFIY